ncbi:hypothetical protein GCM10011579_082960 [Streptomyces albiflavescens]|uniref:Uncharacterized protein n=1 Tax=Streptomyces albiflavescens TaxID=1623582 RepID=A0A917YDA8_9ACTN|nr:hypothetical protein [Streptomyces albiflavescens]GGN88842.1 hypothetical protein GCM10011579_082960 [Streptomyces albiflavescens]
MEEVVTAELVREVVGLGEGGGRSVGVADHDSAAEADDRWRVDGEQHVVELEKLRPVGRLPAG